MAYDPRKAAEYATRAMNATSQGECAYYIRKAINAGGIPGSWGHAYQYLEKGADGLNPLERNGFNLIDHNQGLQVGDIGVLNATKDHKYGHIQMWNGNQWVSDFGQNAAKMGPYRKYANGIAPGQTLQVFRYGAPLLQAPFKPPVTIDDVYNRTKREGTETRGIHNNNPGNIRYNKNNAWNGQTGSDPDFSIFSDPRYGIRAMARIVSGKQRDLDGISLTDMLNKYAPNNENDTARYIKFVSGLTGIDPNEKINLKDPDTLTKVVTSMMQMENSYVPYTLDQIKEGVHLGLNMGMSLSDAKYQGLSNNVSNPQTVLDSPLANRNTFWDGIWNDYNSYKKPTEGALSYREGSPLYNTFAGIHNLMASLRRN